MTCINTRTAESGCLVAFFCVLPLWNCGACLMCQKRKTLAHDSASRQHHYWTSWSICSRKTFSISPGHMHESASTVSQTTSCNHSSTPTHNWLRWSEQSLWNVSNSTMNQSSSAFKGKPIPLQAWTGPEVSRRLRPPDFKTIVTWK